jgi:hypothetical protein
MVINKYLREREREREKQFKHSEKWKTRTGCFMYQDTKCIFGHFCKKSSKIPKG